MKHIYLRQARERAGLTQVELGARAGVGQRTISRLESDPSSEPSFKTWTAIADALGLDPRALLSGPEAATGERRAGADRRKGGRRRTNRVTQPDRRKEPRR